MRHLNKKLAIAAALSTVVAAMGVSFAQTPDNDPMATPQEVTDPQQVPVTANASGQQIYFFHDQGNAPETDPAAHLMMIKHQQMMPVAQTTTTTTVAQATTPADTTSTAMPAASDTSNTETAADTAAAPVDNTPALAPKADRN